MIIGLIYKVRGVIKMWSIQRSLHVQVNGLHVHKAITGVAAGAGVAAQTGGQTVVHKPVQQPLPATNNTSSHYTQVSQFSFLKSIHNV